jgi:hypothetical protein
VNELLTTGERLLDNVKANEKARWGGYEPLVDEEVVAEFLSIKPRRVLEMARKGLIPSMPMGCVRKTWRFRISEVHAAFSAPAGNMQGQMSLEGTPTQRRKRLG